jgi:hypothetical protein
MMGVHVLHPAARPAASTLIRSTTRLVNRPEQALHEGDHREDDRGGDAHRGRVVLLP